MTRSRAVRALAVALLLPAALLASPSPDGLSGIIRLPSAHIGSGTTTFHRDDGTGIGASATYPLFRGLEGGLTRFDGDFGLHAKFQLVPEVTTEDTFLPAFAFGVQDFRRDFGPRRYFWAVSKTFTYPNWTVHGGMRRSDGFFSGDKEYYGGLEVPVSTAFRFKTEYDFGTRLGSYGVETQVRPNVVAYAVMLDAYGSRPNSTRMLGISYQSHF